MGVFISLDDLYVRPVLSILLQDKTMKRNIIWATDSYASLGEYYRDSGQITQIGLRNLGAESIQPRVLKDKDDQQQRTRKHGEVQTPAWLCAQMNDTLDEEWFEREHVFGALAGQMWTPSEGKINFPKHRHSSWRQYIDSRRLEITCGEAPFIVSRYDAATGEAIPVGRRIGLLDRKLRIVDENTDSEQDWIDWAIRAVQSVYGYEYQGDNLLIARINVLMTFVEYMQAVWNRGPTEKELRTVADIVAWNFWQMDGMTNTVPKGKLQASEPKPVTMEELGWFAGIDRTRPIPKSPEAENTPPCLIRNWRQTHNVKFDSLRTKSGRDVRNMKFDYVIGNPPYQDDRQGESTTALPVYHQFMDAAYQVGAAVELITPARFLFNAGRTPKRWNEQMLNDPHLTVLYYEGDGSKVFPNTEIKGGVVITYRDLTKTHHPIGVFTIYPELNAILERIQSFNEPAFSKLGFVASKFNSERLFADYPQYNGHERRMSSNVLSFDCFHDEPSSHDIRIYGIHGKSKNRCFRAVDEKYVDMSELNIQRFKIVMPKADGNGTFGDTLTMPEILPPRTGFTHTFLGIGGFDSEVEANAALKYIKTKLFRALLGVLKVTQDLNADKFNFVPLQDFTPASNIDWSQSIADIDRQLYRKYSLTDEETDFIETHVKEMT